jgi:hypothetical protein
MFPRACGMMLYWTNPIVFSESMKYLIERMKQKVDELGISEER